MIRSTEIDLHARAKELFERENPGRLWRVPASASANPRQSHHIAGMIERQNYLARVRSQMRLEGAFLEDDEFPPQPGARR